MRGHADGSFYQEIGKKAMEMLGVKSLRCYLSFDSSLGESDGSNAFLLRKGLPYVE